MHHIYHTKALVIGSKNIGEANKFISLYTRELGLIRASAQGVRLGKSKLRFALQDFSYSKVDLVRGRDIWRITSATPVSLFSFARTHKEKILFMVRINSLIDRLCAGEESNSQIFDSVLQAYTLLDDEDFDMTKYEALELHTVLSVLHSLGYIGDSDLLARYLGKDFDSDNTEFILKERTSIISHINRALRESGL